MNQQAPQLGQLYVVATPIGNLNDFSPRAVQCLKQVDLIAAEDTRHSRKLLDAWQIQQPLTALHEHNEQKAGDKVLQRLLDGDNVALISDAGTPLISDPGQKLLPRLIEAGINIVAIPGPCAITTALSGAGLPTQPYWFEGFLPAKSSERRKRLGELSRQQATLVFYEAPHRISNSLKDLSDSLGSERQACVARELTKKFESFHRGKLSALSQLFDDSKLCRGEMVVLVAGNSEPPQAHNIDSEQLLKSLVAELPVKAAAKLCSQITGEHKNALYQRALELKNSDD